MAAFIKSDRGKITIDSFPYEWHSVPGYFVVERAVEFVVSVVYSINQCTPRCVLQVLQKSQVKLSVSDGRRGCSNL